MYVDNTYLQVQQHKKVLIIAKLLETKYLLSSKQTILPIKKTMTPTYN